MTTLGDMVTAIQREVLSDLREETNQLGAALTDTTTATISLASGQTLGSIQSGSIIQIDWELMFVIGSPSPQAIPVIRGYLGSVATTHAINALINVNPRFPAKAIVDAINQDIDDYSSPSNGLFQMLEL